MLVLIICQVRSRDVPSTTLVQTTTGALSCTHNNKQNKCRCTARRVNFFLAGTGRTRKHSSHQQMLMHDAPKSPNQLRLLKHLCKDKLSHLPVCVLCDPMYRHTSLLPRASSSQHCQHTPSPQPASTCSCKKSHTGGAPEQPAKDSMPPTHVAFSQDACANTRQNT